MNNATRHPELFDTTEREADRNVQPLMVQAGEAAPGPAPEPPPPRQQVVGQSSTVAAPRDRGGMEHTPEIGALITALAKAQADPGFGQVKKTLTAIVKSKKGENSSYSYDYAPLSEVLDNVVPYWAKYGVALMQFPQTVLSQRGDHGVIVTTFIAHGESGQWIKNSLGCRCDSDPQSIGSATAYMRRYALQSMAGVAGRPEEDDDGARASRRNDDSQAPTETRVNGAARTAEPNTEKAPTFPSDVFRAGSSKGWSTRELSAFIERRFGKKVSELARGDECAKAFAAVVAARGYGDVT